MSPPETGIWSRPATQDDLTILWDFLTIAAYEPDADAAKAVPFVAAHLAGWQRPEDFGFIAERDGVAIGAAWAPQFAPDEQPAFFVDERTPEITIGVSPHIRGRGVGRMLLHALFAEAARRGVGLGLNVRHDNPARRLYERVGFRLVPGSGIPNRVGGTFFGMLWAASVKHAVKNAANRKSATVGDVWPGIRTHLRVAGHRQGTMKIIVIGGTGLIGSKTVAILCQGGHEVVAASPNSGVNTITGEGLKEAVAGAPAPKLRSCAT